MNQLAPYAAFFMRLAVGGVFLQHGLTKWQRGVDATGVFLGRLGFPLPEFWAIVLIVVETVGAVCVLFGMFTRAWAAVMAVEMLVAILLAQLPRGANVELEALLFAGALTLVALGDGPLSIAVKLKKGQ